MSVGHLSCQSFSGSQCSSPHQVFALSPPSVLEPSLPHRVDDVFSEKKDDPTSLTSALRETELVGLLRMLYAMLLHDGPPRHSSSPPPLPPHTLSISTASLRAINNFAILDLHMVQARLTFLSYSSPTLSLYTPELPWSRGCVSGVQTRLQLPHVVSVTQWHVRNFIRTEFMTSSLSIAVFSSKSRFHFPYMHTQTHQALFIPWSQ